MSDQDPPGEPDQVDTPLWRPHHGRMPGDARRRDTAHGAVAPGDHPPEPPETGEPPAEPPDRRRWMIIGCFGILARGSRAALPGPTMTTRTRHCESTTTTESSTTTASTTTTTAAAPTTTRHRQPPPPATPTTVEPARCVTSTADNPETTAKVVYDAYTVADRACASDAVTAAAIDPCSASRAPAAAGSSWVAGTWRTPTPRRGAASFRGQFHHVPDELRRDRGVDRLRGVPDRRLTFRLS